MRYLSWCEDLFPGLPAIILINVALSDELWYKWRLRAHTFENTSEAYLNCFYYKVIIWADEVFFSYFLCFINDFTIMNRSDSFSKLEWRPSAHWQGASKSTNVWYIGIHRSTKPKVLFTSEWICIVFTLTLITWSLSRIKFTRIDIVYNITTSILYRLHPS